MDDVKEKMKEVLILLGFILFFIWVFHYDDMRIALIEKEAYQNGYDVGYFAGYGEAISDYGIEE